MAPQKDWQALMASGSRDVPWYQAEPGDFSPECRVLLEKYSGIEPSNVNAHVLAVRERAWTVFPYPCLGQFRFLNLSISLHPSYQRILSLIKEDRSQTTLLDLGCCFAQDIRKLVYDGAPSENLYACDLKPEFMELSYELFRDKETMKADLFAADIFEEPGTLDKLYGKIDIVYAGSFFHLFSWDDQMKVCKRVIKILKSQKGSLVFGRQWGNLNARAVPTGKDEAKDGPTMWRHNAESFEKMWRIAGEETGTKWKIWVNLDEGEGMASGHWAEEDLRRLRFEIERLE